jgi:hypothetical protein
MFFTSFQQSQIKVVGKDQGCKDERENHDPIQKCDIAEPWQIAGNCKIEGYEKQKVCSCNIASLYIIFKEESYPGNKDNDKYRYKYSQGIVYQLPLAVKPERELGIGVDYSAVIDAGIITIDNPIGHAQVRA